MQIMKTKFNTRPFEGMTLGFLVFLLLYSSFITVPATKAADQSPLFSITLLAPTSNPVRRQHAALIANAMQSVGIDARVVYVTFTDLQARLFVDDITTLGKSFANGGWDIGFIGWGYTSPVPDIKSNYYGSKEAWPPTGNNYALYNSSTANALLDQIYTTTDPNAQLSLFKQLSVVVNRDKPYLPVYMPADIIARKPEIKIFGDANVFSTMTTPMYDIQFLSGLSSYTFAEVGDWNSLAPWNTADSNSFYSLFVFGATQGGLQLVDPRTNTFYLNEAESITASTDGRTWTIKIKPGVLFHDGVEATSEDYMFAEEALMTPAVASVALSDKLARFGNFVEFDWLDGTKTYVDNSDGALTVPTSVFKAIDRYTYQFIIGPTVEPYAFLSQTECAISALPKHYLEQIPFEDWNQSPFATGLAGAYTITWDKAKYGGSGTYTAYGPIGTGPYVYKGFDPVKRLSTLVKFEDYWDRDRLEALGYYTVQNFYVVTIVEKDAAIAAYRTGDIDGLDVNYQLAADQDLLRSLGANVFSMPTIGWQEMAFNMLHPIVGTGLGTPVGIADPSKAAEAARHVRQAISYLIPRELVVQQLLSGAGEAGTTVFKAFGPAFQDPTIVVDPYDPIKARAELAAAGYATGVSPIVPITPAPEVAADYLYGQAVPVGGVFKNPVSGDPYVNFVVRIQESRDNVTWIDTAYAPLTDTTGTFNSMIVPDWETTYFRAYFTGYVVSTDISGAWPITAGSYYDELVEQGKVQQILPPQIGPSVKVTTRNLKDILTNALQPYATSGSLADLSGKVATKTDVSDLTSQITALKSSVDTLTSYLYLSIAVAVIAILIAGYTVMRKK
jgi:ABC-type transport system substrate-binding protein